MAAKPLDVSQTASSTHWQYPPKRPSANANSRAVPVREGDRSADYSRFRSNLGSTQKKKGTADAVLSFVRFPCVSVTLW